MAVSNVRDYGSAFWTVISDRKAAVQRYQPPTRLPRTQVEFIGLLLRNLLSITIFWMCTK